jgi:hypothetical protein
VKDASSSPEGFVREARISSAHETWNFLPVKDAPEISVAFDRSFIYTGGKE